MAFEPPPPPSGTCPFCTIAKTFPVFHPSSIPATSPSPSPSPPTSIATTSSSPSATSSQPRSPLEPSLTTPSTFLLLSTPLSLAFLDIMPLAMGHLLVTTRAHHEKLSDVTEAEAAELGKWLRVCSRVLARVQGVWDWNVVQNNGAAAAQVVPHVHFHIIPRPALSAEARNRSFTMFGRGQRSDLDEDEALELVVKLRAELAREVEGENKGKL